MRLYKVYIDIEHGSTKIIGNVEKIDYELDDYTMIRVKERGYYCDSRNTIAGTVFY